MKHRKPFDQLQNVKAIYKAKILCNSPRTKAPPPPTPLQPNMPRVTGQLPMGQ